MLLKAILAFDIKAHTFGDFQHRRERKEGLGAVAGPPCEGVSRESGAQRWLGLHAGMPAEREAGAPRASRQCKAICQAHPHSSESQNEMPARIDQQERMGAIRHFKKK